ncbi:uncharacterized protein LOC108916712 isoform X2 [Anoplophora glabripennis]|uniref:uncharacterized protein LOC108916712 isoform X2 n=1 Tax=Anoplophora glabripennis TaxID=217634 RepID=UPI000873A64F|nr:uncharacterized protein LOC108916712 isoform X2 [Anoplophora glabripennis]
MTNGRGAGMASFMTKKKKYKFQVEICLEELLEVPFVSAVLFAKLRLLDGGNFQDHSSRQEVRDHRVHWGANFTFPCKMMANASTGVMERCILRISIRKESKGGRSFNKLGFVDLNLAEYAGAGLTHKKALLEGYDTRHRQDNSMLKFKIELNMISGDILFKAPSPSLKHKQVNADDASNEQRSDEFSSGSLAGSIASGSSGFGSLPKKRPALLASDLVIGQTLTENNNPITIAADCNSDATIQLPTIPSSTGEHLDQQEAPCEPGHSRNSSNTSQLSKASGYSSIHSHTHSRQSSSGDSGHIRTHTYPKKINIPNTIHASHSEDVYSTPVGVITSTPIKAVVNNFIENESVSTYSTPKGYQTQVSYVSNSSAEEYKTPETTFINAKTDIFSQNFNELQKSSSTSVVERIKTNMLTIDEVEHRKSDTTNNNSHFIDNRLSLEEMEKNKRNSVEGVLRSKSEFEIPRMPNPPIEKSFASKFFKSDSLFSFLTPRPKRKSLSEQASPNRTSPTNLFKVPGSPVPKLNSLPETRTTSLSSLRSGHSSNEGLLSVQLSQRNPSAGSLVLSETGSLDRAKAAYERRKKNQVQESDMATVPGRVEITRVNPDDLIEELLKNTNLEQADDSAETSGLQLFIAKDGTAALGNHEVKSQMSTGVQVFKQVVMDDR